MQKVGDKVGDYILERHLDDGEFGEVWPARPVRESLIHPQVALKFPYPGKVKLAEVRREALVWKAASGHENVLALVDAWVEGDETRGQVIIASEYAPDGTLEKWLKQPREPLEACQMMDGILAGLNHLHTRPQAVIHRDLKPKNVLLQGAVPKLADFGLSRIFQDGATMIAAGTPSYMAPECFEKKYDTPSDVWAAGVLLYRMLARRLPFRLPPDTSDYLKFGEMYKLVSETPPHPAPHIPAPLWAIIASALCKEIGTRPTAAVMRDELQRAAARLYGGAGPVVTDPEQTVYETEPPPDEAARRAVEESSKRLATGEELAHLQEQIAAEAARRKQAETEAEQLRAAQRHAAGQQAEARPQAARQEPSPEPFTAPAPANPLWPKMAGISAAVVLGVALLGYALSGGSSVKTPVSVGPSYADTLPNGVKLEMVTIPAGAFKMGSPSNEEGRFDNETQHDVTISQPFQMGKYEVTQGQWKAVMGGLPDKCDYGSLTGEFVGDDKPIICVSWDDA